MNVNEFFPDQICINLDRRPDRWKKMRSRFTESGIDRVVRFPAIDGSSVETPSVWQSFPGAYGCLQSHLAIVENARMKALPRVLIFEDDVVLAPDLDANFARYVKQLPADWDMLFFGAIHGQPLIKVAGNIIRVTHSLSTYAYALKQTIYDGFIEVNRKATGVLDENTRELQKRFNCYCFMPHLAWVEEDYSDVREERINLWWLKESLVLHGPDVEEILRNAVAIIGYRNCNRSSFRNLTFTIDYLFQTLPNITILVVELGQQQSVKADVLPSYCQFEYLTEADGNQKSLIMKRGFDLVGSDKQFFLFMDSDVFLTKEEIKASLLKCRDYDFTSSFREICALNETQTCRLLSGDERWDHNGVFPSRRQAVTCDASCIITRRGLRVLASGINCEDLDDCALSARIEKLLRVYVSPNVARRLSSV